MTSTGDFRVGDAERDEAVSELRRAAEDGRLTAEELDERVARARSARTVGELAFVLGDLRAPSGGLVLPTVPDQLGYRGDSPLALSAGFSGERRTGRWTVPPYLRVQALFDTVRIDCLQARFAAPVIDLDVQPGAGTVVMVLPEGWAVNADRLTKGLGTITTKVPVLPAPGCPLFVVHGNLGLGTLKARGANALERRRLRRAR